jgi:hypothetical protein
MRYWSTLYGPIFLLIIEAENKYGSRLATDDKGFCVVKCLSCMKQITMTYWLQFLKIMANLYTFSFSLMFPFNVQRGVEFSDYSPDYSIFRKYYSRYGISPTLRERLCSHEFRVHTSYPGCLDGKLLFSKYSFFLN